MAAVIPQRCIILGGYLLLACTAGVIRAAPDSMLSPPAQARDYVFAACLIDKYRGLPIAAKAEVWAGGLVELGSLSGDLYPNLAQLAQTLAPPPQTSRDGTPMLMQSCMSLYNSPVLGKEIARLLRR